MNILQKISKGPRLHLSKGVFAVSVNVTPKIAEQLSELNTNNRSINPSHTANLQAQMLNGNWRVLGTPIQFSKEGVMLNGQHTVEAIKTSGVPQKMLVVLGLEQRDISKIDQGYSRTMFQTSQIFKKQGFKRYSSAIQLAINWEHDQLESFRARKMGKVDHDRGMEIFDSKISKEIRSILDSIPKPEPFDVSTLFCAGYALLRAGYKKSDVLNYIKGVATGISTSQSIAKAREAGRKVGNVKWLRVSILLHGYMWKISGGYKKVDLRVIPKL